MNKRSRWLVVLVVLVFLGGASPAGAFRKDREERREVSSARTERQIARLRAVMMPLLRVTDHRLSLEDVQLSIINDPAINAASAGDGRYFVTRGLLERANDEQLRGVLAHEIAHEDLGHPSRAQIVGVGINLGVALLEELFPGSSSVTPLAGTLISNTYTRPLELEADRHAVTLLERAGYSKKTMIDTLSWLERSNGDTGGSILSSHPATSERIAALRALR